MQSFNKLLLQKTEVASSWLARLAPKGGGSVARAARYALEAGGKRIRPVLALAVCRALGGGEAAVMPFACAVEFIHTYSLIHDDLPCMDNDDLRRGKPSCHIKYGEAAALLAGDALLTHAFETASHAKADAALITEVIKVLSSAAGIGGMIGGQAMDIEGVSTAEGLTRLCKMKTGALICAAAKIGVLSSGCSDKKVLDSAARYGENLGIAFQIKDDLLDVLGDERLIGKRVGKDAQAGKKTFVDHLGIDGARAALAGYTEGAKEALGMFGDRGEFLRCFADYLLGRQY